MTKFKKFIPLLLCGAMCVSFAFGTACNTESGDDAEDDTNISNTEIPDDGTGSGEAETPDDGTGSGEAETPDDGTGSGETETTGGGTESGESEIVYTVTESEWDAALSYEKTLNCTVNLLVTDGTYGNSYTGYMGLSESDGIITGKVYLRGDYFKTIDGVDDVYSSVDQYEYQTDTYRIYAKNYSDSSDGETEYSIEYNTEGYYDRLVSLINLDEPLFMFLDEEFKEMYFNYSDFVYDETANEYVYNASQGSVTVIFENGYVTYVKLFIGSEGYWEWKFSNYGTTNVEEYFTDEVMAGISEYYESLTGYYEVMLSSYEISVEVGQARTLVVAIVSGETVIFTVADESVVSITTLGSSTAILKGISEGTTTVTATVGEYSATCTVTVTAAETSDE